MVSREFTRSSLLHRKFSFQTLMVWVNIEKCGKFDPDTSVGSTRPSLQTQQSSGDKVYKLLCNGIKTHICVRQSLAIARFLTLVATRFVTPQLPISCVRLGSRKMVEKTAKIKTQSPLFSPTGPDHCLKHISVFTYLSCLYSLHFSQANSLGNSEQTSFYSIKIGQTVTKILILKVRPSFLNRHNHLRVQVHFLKLPF